MAWWTRSLQDRPTSSDRTSTVCPVGRRPCRMPVGMETGSTTDLPSPPSPLPQLRNVNGEGLGVRLLCLCGWELSRPYDVLFAGAGDPPSRPYKNLCVLASLRLCVESLAYIFSLRPLRSLRFRLF